MNGSRPAEPKEFGRLRHCERSIYRIVARVNGDKDLLWMRRQWNHWFLPAFAWPFLNRVVHVVRPEIFRNLPSDRPLVLVANHLTFWDLFVISVVRYWINGRPRIGYYPVRSTFFYDNPFGLLLNLIFAGGSMWPPIFREPRLARLNLHSFRIVSELSGDPRSLIGLHPEGTRNRTGDPYRLLPGRSGTGRLLLSAWASGADIVPVFLRGVHPWLPVQLLRNLARSEPMNIVVGEPLDLARLTRGGQNAATFQATVDFVMERLTALGQEERALRTARPRPEHR